MIASCFWAGTITCPVQSSHTVCVASPLRHRIKGSAPARSSCRTVLGDPVFMAKCKGVSRTSRIGLSFTFSLYGSTLSARTRSTFNSAPAFIRSSMTPCLLAFLPDPHTAQSSGVTRRQKGEVGFCTECQR